MCPRWLMLCLAGLVASEPQARTPPPREDNNLRDDFAYEQDAFPPTEHLTLWYRKPATKWETQALPVGNGRLAAMVFGGVDHERIQFNEETVWEGTPADTNNPDALKALPEVRRLLFEGKNGDATRLAKQKMMGNPYRIGSYQTLGDLFLDFPAVDTISDYRRDLDLTKAIARVAYRTKGVCHTRETFVSNPDQVIVMHLAADQRGGLSFAATLQRDEAETVTESRNRLIMRGRLGVGYEAQLLPIVHGGTVTTEGNRLVVSKADQATLLLVGATSYKNADDITADATERCEDALWAAAAKTYQELRSAHLADYQPLFNRVKLDLGTTEAVGLPTDERLREIEAGAHDPQFESLYFQYGRYLLISSSRPGTLPANLQGKWCQHYKAPWNSDYHTNINLQMDYWPAQSCNLRECHLPYFDYMESLVPKGQETAKVHYGARGWVLHHLSDIYGFTTPADGVHGVWPMGAAWLVRDTMEHYRFNGDREFLQQRAYPSKGGNYLLNIGPLGDGSVPSESVERLAAIGRWMDVNGESIYGSTASPIGKPAWGRVTHNAKSNAVYLHVFNWPDDGKLAIEGIPGSVT